MNQLMRDGDADCFLRRVTHHIEHFRFWIVVPDNLLLEEVDEELLQVERIGDHSQPLVSVGHARHLSRSERIRDLASNELSHLRFRARFDLRWLLELEADRVLDRRDRFAYLLTIRSAELRSRLFFGARYQQREAQDCGNSAGSI